MTIHEGLLTHYREEGWGHTACGRQDAPGRATTPDLAKVTCEPCRRVDSAWGRKLRATENDLTPAERKVCWLMAMGQSVGQSAERLNIEPGTVKAHRLAIARKLEARGHRLSPGATLYALRQGWINKDGQPLKGLEQLG